MNPKGLLVVAPHGQEFMLVPEEGSRAAHYTLSIFQQSGGQWVRLQPQSARLLRESMLGALLEFFGNLCRILNQTQTRTPHAKNPAPNTTTSPGNRIRARTNRTETERPRRRQIGSTVIKPRND